MANPHEGGGILIRSDGEGTDPEERGAYWRLILAGYFPKPQARAILKANPDLWDHPGRPPRKEVEAFLSD